VKYDCHNNEAEAIQPVGVVGGAIRTLLKDLQACLDTRMILVDGTVWKG